MMPSRTFCASVLGVLAVIAIASLKAAAGMAGMPGGISDVKSSENDIQLQDLGSFAVNEHNSKQNGKLEFVKVVASKQQVVAGMMYHLTIEATSDGQRGYYEAKVWSKPWESFKSLEEFKSLGPMVTSADLGSEAQDGARETAAMKEIPVDDLSVSEAAEHAVKFLQAKSNSLSPYELKEVVSAQGEQEDGARFHLVLKLKRGTKEETMKVEVHMSEKGHWSLKKSMPF